GVGSTFTLFLPQSYTGPAAVATGEAAPTVVKVLPPPSAEEVRDDRDSLQPGEPVLLIVEDDPHYARVLLGLARDKGFKGLVAMRGNVALSLAREYRPTAISLDRSEERRVGKECRCGRWRAEWKERKQECRA